MSTTPNPIFESALALPDTDRADLAFQLLQTLAPDGDEISDHEFAAELHARVAAHRRGELQSFTIDEARAAINERLAQERAK
jgi:putative addiction module component (TIGR02574 family)